MKETIYIVHPGSETILISDECVIVRLNGAYDEERILSNALTPHMHLELSSADFGGLGESE